MANVPELKFCSLALRDFRDGTPIPVTWHEKKSAPALGKDDVHIWLANCGQGGGKPDVLSDDERSRAAKFRFDRDRDRYTARRAILRQLVGQYLKTKPSGIEFAYNELGKPEILQTSADGGLQFNLSKSGEMAAYAFTLRRRIGIDIETIRPQMDWMEIAERFFHSQEISMLREVPESDRSELFFSYWTMKEAYLKARGVGLQQPLLQMDFAAVVNKGKSVFTDTDGSRWLCGSFRPGEEIIGALVLES